VEFEEGYIILRGLLSFKGMNNNFEVDLNEFFKFLLQSLLRFSLGIYISAITWSLDDSAITKCRSLAIKLLQLIDQEIYPVIG
jgi:hypothetical protein